MDPKCAPYLYTYRPKIGVALSGQEEVPGEVVGNLVQWHSGHSSGGSRCTQVGGLIIDIRRLGRHGAVPVFIILLLILVVEKFSCKRESVE